MDPRLVYGVGVHRGDDTAYYLHKGFRVVGVEANPVMADHLRDRFRSEIASGALQLLQVGVADIEGELDFWVCDAVSEWSSFQERKASAGGKTSHPVKVRTLPFARILGQHGVPFYCKIDIEGNDHLCLEGIDAADKPQYVSVEMSLAKGDRDLSLLHALGYRKFKIISQVRSGRRARRCRSRYPMSQGASAAASSAWRNRPSAGCATATGGSRSAAPARSATTCLASGWTTTARSPRGA